MRASTSLALFALATGSTNAIFCFVKEKKCLPGVKLSLDYDEIPGLLGITTTKSSTMTGTATQTGGASSVMAPAGSEPTVDTAEAPVPANIDTGFLEKLLKKPDASATPSIPPAPLNNSEALATPPVAAAVDSTPPPPPAPEPAPAPVMAALPAPITAPIPAVAAAAAPVAAAPMAIAFPSSPVPDWVRNLIPRGYEQNPAAAEYQSGASFNEPVDTSVESEATPPSYIASSETTDYSSASYVAELPSAYATPATKVYSTVSSVQSSIVVTATYSSTNEVDVTTTITEWVTITPTQTVRLSESSASQKEMQTPAPPKYTATQNETHAIVMPKPSASQPEIISLTTTLEAWAPAPTSLSFSTVASYTAVQKPVEVPASSYTPVHTKVELYPIPSNATTIHSMPNIKPTEAKPTVYVTPVPASYSPWSKTQNMSRPEMPEQYTGAASSNSLNIFFVVAAGVAAMMVL